MAGRYRHAFDFPVDRNHSTNAILALHFIFMVLEDSRIVLGKMKKEVDWYIYACFFSSWYFLFCQAEVFWKNKLYSVFNSEG